MVRLNISLKFDVSEAQARYLQKDGVTTPLMNKVLEEAAQRAVTHAEMMHQTAKALGMEKEE